MTPTKQQHGGKRGSTTRYSILSDPRLSQLFALSSQLEALAQSIDVQPPSPTKNSKIEPPKAFLNNNNSLMMASSVPSLPPKLSNEDEDDTSVEYRRLEDDDLILENNGADDNLQQGMVYAMPNVGFYSFRVAKLQCFLDKGLSM